MPNVLYMETETSTYRVEFSIYGADAQPAWRRAIVSAVTVKADGEQQARALAKAQVPNLTDAAITSVTKGA